MAAKEFQIVTPGCGCCCGPCRDQSPFGHADRIRWYQYALPLASVHHIDNYAVKGVGSEFFARNYTCRRACNTHLWNPDVCQYQLRPDGNPTLSTYHPYHKINIGPRLYEQKWTWDAVAKSWVPLKADGTAWSQGIQVEPDDFTNPVYPLWYGQFPNLGYRLGSPGIQLLYEAEFTPRPVPAALSSPVSLTDGSTTNDALIVNRGWSGVPGNFPDIYYNMVAEGVVETSEGPYGPASVWDRTCIRCPKMYTVRQKLIQHIVSADGLYDFEEILYPVVEYPWSPLHNNSRAFSFSRYPGKTLFDGTVGDPVILGGTVGETSSYEAADTYWNGYFFTGQAKVGGFPSLYTAFPVALAKLRPPYVWNPDLGPTAASTFGDIGSTLLANPATGIQFSLDQRWRRWVGDTYGAWSATSVLQPATDPPHFVRGGYSFPNYVGLGYVKPDYPVSAAGFQTLHPNLRWDRDEPGDPNILTTLGRNRWTTINPVVYFFRDYLWLDGKYRLCDITITEGNEDYVWTPPAGSTTLSFSLIGFPFKNSDGAGENNTVSDVRYPLFQLSGPSGTYTFGGEVGTAIDSGPPLRYGDPIFGVPPVTAISVANGDYEITCLQLPAYKIDGGEWQEMLVTGSWPRNFSAWGVAMLYEYRFSTTVTGGTTVTGIGLATAGLPEINSHVYYQEQHPNGDYRIEQPNYVPFIGIRGGTRDINYIKMVGATVEVYGHATETAPPIGGWPLVATTTTDADGAWEVSATPAHFYVVVNGLFDFASGVDGDPTYYGNIFTGPPFFTYPVTPPVYEVNCDVRIYQPRF